MATRPQGGGRQKGTPNKASVTGRDLALQWGPDAIRKLAEKAGLVLDPDGHPIGIAANEKNQIAALRDIADRAFGRPAQPVIGDDASDPIRQVMRIEFVDGQKPSLN